MSFDENTSTVLAFPDKTIGYICVKNYEKGVSLINAHEAEIVCMSLNFDGTIIATASIKVYNQHCKFYKGNLN